MQTLFPYQPAFLLLIGVGIVALITWFFWPNHGGLSLISKLRTNNQRALLEDALKFIFDCEYKKQVCNVNSVAGNLQIPPDKVGKLLNKLTGLELITINNQKITLTDNGRSYALRVVRIHRILERYLADQTGVTPTNWHNEADRIEHLVTEHETERLAAQLGNPVFDPHGDPIPTSEGQLPKPKGMILSSLNEGDQARIIHLEDEPNSIYEQLNVLGLYPGMVVYVTDVNDKKITFVADGEECVLTPLFAGQITVEPLVEKEPLRQDKYELLSSLKVGETAEVLGISPNCRGLQRRRLMDLGIIPGSKIKAVMQSASGDPMGYRVMSTTIGIRKQHADFVFINRLN